MDFQVTELSKFINTTGGNGVHYLFYRNEKVKFNISHNKLPDFLSKYCEYAAEDEENDDDDNELCVAELIETNKMPLIVTFNLRFQCDEEDEPSLYDEPLLELICHCIQTVQLELLQISQNYPFII